MKENDTERPSAEKLIRCNGSFMTFYWNSPAEGAHLYINIAYIVLNGLLSIPGISLNVLVIMVYWRNRNLRTSSNMLLVVLACSDLMVNSIVQPLFMARSVKEITGTHNCLMWTLARLMSYFCCGVSLLTVAIISIERFITLAYPFGYQSIVSRLRLKIAITSTWLLTLAFVMSHLGPISYAILSSVGVILIILSIITVITTWVWVQRLVRRHKNIIESTQTPSRMKHKTAQPRTEIFHTTSTCYLIVGAVIWFYFPSVVMLAYNAINSDNFVALFLIAPWAETIMFANSAVNPFLLFWRKKAFREKAREILFSQVQNTISSLEEGKVSRKCLTVTK